MTREYLVSMHVVHSSLESDSSRLSVSHITTVENFRDIEINNVVCLEIHEWVLKQYNYELSWNQVCNGVNLFLQNHKAK